MKEFIRAKCKKYKYTYVILLALLFLGTAALLRANFYYVDDLSRASAGHKGWEYFSRYLSVWLSPLIHGDNYLADVAPLPQILALLILSLAGIIAISALSNGRKISPWVAIAAVPIGLSPFYLECLSYRYDAPYIALSVLFSILPVCFLHFKKRWVYPLSILVGTLCMCMTYQASSGIFPMLVILMTFLSWKNGETAQELGYFAISSAVSYCVGLGIFKYLILTPVYSYVSTYQAPLNQLAGTIVSNLKTYIQVIGRDFKPIWLILIGCICAGFILLETLTSKKRNKVLTLGLALVTLVLMFLVSFGAYALLESSFFNPRAMYGFGVFTAFICIDVCFTEREYLFKLTVVALCWLFISFANLYGNCLNVQAEYTDFRIQLIIQDLNDLDEFYNADTKLIKFEGNIGRSQVIQNIPQDNYDMLKDLLPAPFGDGNVLDTLGFYTFYNIPNIITYDYSTDISDMDLPLLKETTYHDIYGDGTYFRIVLK